jgi:ketosteroid isomerase-like protein
VTAKADVEEYLRGFAKSFSNHDAAACASMYSQDALLLPPDAPALAGFSAIEAMFQSIFDSGVRTTELTSRDVIEEGDLIVETGEFTFRMEPSDHVDGKYLAVYRRQADGALLCIREAFNSNAVSAGDSGSGAQTSDSLN